MHWVEVAPKGSDASLTLVTWFDAMPPGSLQGLVIGTDNVHASYEELGAKGVPFDFAPRELPGGYRRCSATRTETVWSSPKVEGRLRHPALRCAPRNRSTIRDGSAACITSHVYG